MFKFVEILKGYDNIVVCVSEKVDCMIVELAMSVVLN